MNVLARWGSGAIGALDRGVARRAPRLLFGQVREDAAVELEALRELGPGRSVACIGSAGCTALTLLLGRPAALHAIDINAAQTHLIRLKIAAFATLSHAEVLAAASLDARPALTSTYASLLSATRDFWAAHRRQLARGWLHSGAVDRGLDAAMRGFQLAVHSPGAIEKMLSRTDEKDAPGDPGELLDAWSTSRWQTALALALHPRALRLAYGSAFVDELPEGFAAWMRQQVEDTLVSTPPALNPYLWQTFLGRFPAADAGLPLHLRQASFPQLRDALPAVEVHTEDLARWVSCRPRRSIDLFVLSNILEVSPAGYGRTLLDAIRDAAVPDAIVVMRSIRPTSAPIHEGFRVDTVESARLSRLDRSPFCRQIHLLRVGG